MSTPKCPRPLFLDLATNRVGEVRARFEKDFRPAVWMRPEGGGREWTTFRDNLRVVPVRTEQAA